MFFILFNAVKIVFYEKCVIPELYESNWCVFGDTPALSHKISIKLIYFDALGSSFRKIINKI